MQWGWSWLALCVGACVSVSGLDEFRIADGATGGTATHGGGARAGTAGTSPGGHGGTGGDGGGAQAGGAAAGGSGGAASECDALFATIYPMCQLCGEENGACVVWCGIDSMGNSGGQCDQICAGHGVDCVAFEDDNDICVGNGTLEACDTGGIALKRCHCGKLCGGGPQCAAGMVCNNGVCE